MRSRKLLLWQVLQKRAVGKQGSQWLFVNPNPAAALHLNSYLKSFTIGSCAEPGGRVYSCICLFFYAVFALAVLHGCVQNLHVLAEIVVPGVFTSLARALPVRTVFG